MPRIAPVVLCMLLISTAPSAAQTRRPAGAAAPFSGQLMLGYNSGLAFDAGLVSPDFGARTPLRARLSFRYAAVDPGVALAARHIFINDNTDGTPESSGRTWGFKLDLAYPVRVLSLPRAYLFAGARYAHFTGDFRFVGGNEDFEVTSHHWGVGAGIETNYPIGRGAALTFMAGLDYFYANTMYGHDTSYSPDGTSVNGRNGYTCADADRAIGQPKLDPIAMAGVTFHF